MNDLSHFVFCGDSSEYSTELARSLEESEVELLFADRAVTIEQVLNDVIDAIVLVNPHVHLLRSIRRVLDNIGGRIAQTPIICAFADEEFLSETESFRLADDFIINPAKASELKKRVEVILLKRFGSSGNVIQEGELVIDLDSRRVFNRGRQVDLTYKEFELLSTLATTPGRVYSRDDLLRTVWGFDFYGGTRTVDVHVRRIRSKIESERRYIETVHGVGYRFSS